jgi:cystathionine beta-lyase/cystathionine gamma-synthase
MKGEPVVPPIVHSATFRFETTADLIDVVQHRTGYIYSRWDNPTVREVERRLAGIEGTDEAVAFASGMAAITTSLLAHASSGDRIVAMATYGETVRFLVDFLPSIGIEAKLFAPDESDACVESLRSGASVLYMESPMNPLLRIVDVETLAVTAHEQDAIVLLDATFASPINLRPRALGVDVVLHSATKYLGGHHDVTAGFACCDEAAAHRIWMLRRMLGGVLDPTQAYLVWRGLQTLEVRVARQNESAARIAEWLDGQPSVRAVHYPGLPSHPDHALAVRQMHGFGGMVSFELETDGEGTSRFMDGLRTIKLATSLGGVTSLANQSVTNTHASMSEAERAKAGISESLVRLSVGLEPVDDLIADLEQAFGGAAP